MVIARTVPRGFRDAINGLKFSAGNGAVMAVTELIIKGVNVHETEL